MKICEERAGGGGGGGGGGLVLFERIWTSHSLSRGVVIKLHVRWQMPIFLFLLLSYSNIFLKHFCLLVLVLVVTN